MSNTGRRFAFKLFFVRVSMLILCSVTFFASTAPAQSSGATLRGRVTFENRGEPVDNVTVTIVQLNRTTQTNEEGLYVLENVPLGAYDVAARLVRFPDRIVRVTVAGDATLDLELQLSTVRENVTVTASSAAETVEEAIRPTTVIDSVRLAERAHTSIGEVLEYEPGVAKRSFGPGTSRPVIRGFDGDRVLVLQDSLSIGSLGSQSGDHGEPINVTDLEQVEIVRGPATLLYGSNAIGGVVNTITGRETAPLEPRGYMTAYGGSGNRQAGAAAGFEIPFGKFSLFGSSGGGRTGDYRTPIGVVRNSGTRSYNGSAGFGYFADKAYFKLYANYDERLYGVPFAANFEGGDEGVATTSLRRSRGREVAPSQIPVQEEFINLRMRRQNFRFNGGLRNLDNAFLSGFQLFADYSDYEHRELEGEAVGTIFNNDQFTYRGVFELQRRGRLSGRFGFQGLRRDYEAVGEETLAPPTVQNNFAAFGLQELDLGRITLQFGGRAEMNRYTPEGLPKRSFTGFSGSVGTRFRLFEDANLVANFSHSYRSPALEELYNFGPHVGNLTFEIGDPDLRRELSNGLDVSFRYGSRRASFEANVYYYDIQDFVFLQPTGEIEDGLIEAIYSQADSRFFGTEIGMNFALIPNRLLLDTSIDYVSARLDDETPLPRIPPLRARVGLELIAKGFRVQPEAIFAGRQDDIFPTETPTAGYTLFNLRGSYTISQEHFAHIFTVNAFNLTDRLYRNHLSFIKDLAPEIGRGVRVAYTVRFF